MKNLKIILKKKLIKVILAIFPKKKRIMFKITNFDDHIDPIDNGLMSHRSA